MCIILSYWVTRKNTYRAFSSCASIYLHLCYILTFFLVIYIYVCMSTHRHIGIKKVIAHTHSFFYDLLYVNLPFNISWACRSAITVDFCILVLKSSYLTEFALVLNSYSHLLSCYYQPHPKKGSLRHNPLKSVLSLKFVCYCLWKCLS